MRQGPQPRQQQNRHIRRVLPDIHHRDRQQRGIRPPEPDDVLADAVVDHAVVGIEQQFPAKRRDHRRDHHRHHQQRCGTAPIHGRSMFSSSAMPSPNASSAATSRSGITERQHQAADELGVGQQVLVIVHTPANGRRTGSGPGDQPSKLTASRKTAAERPNTSSMSQIVGSTASRGNWRSIQLTRRRRRSRDTRERRCSAAATCHGTSHGPGRSVGWPAFRGRLDRVGSECQFGWTRWAYAALGPGLTRGYFCPL